MILPDEDPSTAKAPACSTITTPLVARDFLEGSSALDDPPPAYAPPASTEVTLLLPRVQHESPQSSKRRFLTALICAMFLLLLLGSPFALLFRHQAPHTSKPRDSGDLGYCMGFEKVKFDSREGLYRGLGGVGIVSKAPILTFQSLSPLVTGDLTIAFSPDMRKGFIGMDITGIHKHRAALDSINLCIAKSPGGESRAVVYVSDSDSDSNWGSNITLGIDVLLPPDMDDNGHIYFPELRTNMHFFKQKIVFEEELIYFKRLDLRSVDSNIILGGIVTEVVNVSNINGDISAHLLATDSASFETSNGTIRVNAEIINTAPEKNSVVSMVARHGSIVSRLDLQSPSPSGGSFNISASCSHSPLILTIPGQPPESTLHLAATAEQSQAYVYLPPAFEGALSAFSRSQIYLSEERHVSDPRGEGRERRVDWEVTNLDRLKQAHGRVRWKPSYVNGTGGDVVVRALDAPLTISV